MRLYLRSAWQGNDEELDPAPSSRPDPDLPLSERAALRCLFGELGVARVPARAEVIARDLTATAAFALFARRAGCWSMERDLDYLRAATRVHLELDGLRDLCPNLAPDPVHQLLRWRRIKPARRLVEQTREAAEALDCSRHEGGPVMLETADRQRLEKLWGQRDARGIGRLLDPYL